VGIAGLFGIAIAGLWILTSLLHREAEPRECRESVSVIVPAHNEEQTIGACIRSLDGQADEIVLVLDGCVDQTRAEADKAISSMKTPAKVIELPHGGKSHALNTGIKNSTGQIVVTVDSDSVFSPNAITNLTSRIYDRDAVCGATRGKEPRTPIQRWKSVTKLICVNVFRKGMSRINALFCMPGAIMAVRREVLDELGCFDESFRGAEDMELTWRLLAARKRIDVCPSSVAYTEDPRDIRSLVRQFKKWFMGYSQVVRKHHRVFGTRSGPGLVLLTFQGWLLSYVYVLGLPLQLYRFSSSTLVVWATASALVLAYAVLAMAWTHTLRENLQNLPYALVWFPMLFVVRICWVVYGTVGLFRDVGHVEY